MLDELKKLKKRLKEKLNHLNKVIRYVQKQTNKFYIAILFDLIWCYLIYTMDIEEYRKLELYNSNHDQRKTYLNKFKHDLLKKLMYKKDILPIIRNKEKFLKRFENYIQREIKNVNDISFKQFEEILLKNKKIICRSKNSDFISSYQVYDATNFRGPGFVLEKIKNNKIYYIEKYIEPPKKLKEITDELVVINLVTMVNNNKIDVISSYITYKENNEIIRGYIDIKKSKVKGHLRDSNNCIYDEKVVNYDIPYIDEMIEYVKELAKEIDEIKEVEWSLCLDNKGKIYLMDACTWKNYIFAQTPEYTNKKIGLLPYYKKTLLKNKREN